VLRRADGTSNLCCDHCIAQWPVRDGIPCFVPLSKLPDYGLAADMDRLARQARSEGWLRALETHLAQNAARRDYVREYVASEARADFRFLMSLPSDATILDVGSGWGTIAVALARTSRCVYALDTTLANLAFVQVRAEQEGLSNVVAVMGDATCLPIPPSSCDAVLMVGVLEWVPWGRDDGSPQDLQSKALHEAYRVLKPGGQIYVGIENRFSVKSFLGAKEPHTGLRFISLLPRSLANAYSRRLRQQPFREWTYSQQGLTSLLLAAGFATVRFHYPIPSYQNIRYITNYEIPWVTRFLITRFMGHGRFSESLRLAGLCASALRLEKSLSPCFSIVGTKAHD
jgi:ubiquinone/menaquinone biosynthesis C-methylase UbiE